ncbi:MAG: hypothetical protein IPI65_06305 [Bacteroidetes bacterium]|nr:hypothetical protein [Bacteroidota bacterium]
MALQMMLPEGNSDSLLQILGVTEETDVFTQALPSRINISANKMFGESFISLLVVSIY